MSASRQVRRAAERQLRKLESKRIRDLASAAPHEAAILSEPQVQEDEAAILSERNIQYNAAALPGEPPKSTPPLSSAQLAANRANSHLSTGPKTPEGKAKSSLNAVKTGLTGRTVLLPTEDAAAYQKHVRDFFHELRPVTPREHALAQSLADTAWRLDRIPALEMAIYAQGRLEFANAFDEHDPALRSGLIELHTHLAYEKQLRNLHLQEMRLRRQREKDTAEFRQLKEERNTREREELETAAKLYTAAQHDHTHFDPADYGFDFAISDVEGFLDGIRAANLLNARLKGEYEAAKSQAAAA